MRVTFVAPYAVHRAERDVAGARFGGVEVAVLRLAQGLARRGHRVTVLASAAREALHVDADGVRHACIRRRGTFLGTPIARFDRLPGSDLVHVVATYPGVSDVAVAAARRAGVPVVLDYHFDGHAPGPAGVVAARAYYALAARALLAADAVLVKSRSYAEASPLLRRVPRDRLHVVPNGVDPHAFPLREGPRAGVLCVGRLVPYKGVETLVRAAALLPREVPVSVAGDGPLRPSLERLARRLDAPVRFLGRVPEAELPALYAHAAATALPSANRQEAFGICLVESLATGTPVVASDLPGVRDVALLGGSVVPPRDPRALAEALARTVEEPPAPPAVLARRVAEAYSWERVVDALETAYADVRRRPA